MNKSYFTKHKFKHSWNWHKRLIREKIKPWILFFEKNMISLTISARKFSVPKTKLGHEDDISPIDGTWKMPSFVLAARLVGSCSVPGSIPAPPIFSLDFRGDRLRRATGTPPEARHQPAWAGHTRGDAPVREPRQAGLRQIHRPHHAACRHYRSTVPCLGWGGGGGHQYENHVKPAHDRYRWFRTYCPRHVACRLQTSSFTGALVRDLL